MNIQAVIVCKDYGDFIAHSLPENIGAFDHIVVVTHHTDKMTKSICSKYSVECVEAHAFDEDGDRFNKGRAVNIGLAHLKNPDWIVHIDADIVLPKQFRNMLDRARLSKNNLYGCDRLNVFGFEMWQKVLKTTNPHYKDFWFVEPNKDLPMGSRIIHREHGYVPIGFFQMWNREQHKKYPIYEGTAEHSDVLFAIQWHRSQRQMLPEVFTYHLDAHKDQKTMGENWYGRKSPNFCPCHQWNWSRPKPHPHPYKPKPHEPHPDDDG